MAEFASLDGQNQNIPTGGGSVNPMNLTAPNSIITGTTAGLQALGAQNIKTDAINQRIVVNDGITNRVSFGKIGKGVNDWGLKVSKPNLNVDTASNNDLIFNSSQDVFKIVGSGTANINAISATAGTAITNSIPHGLSFIPAFLAYFSNGSAYYQMPNSTGWGSSAGAVTFTNWLFAYTDITNINLVLIPSSTGNLGQFPIRYYILQETAN